MKQHLPQPRRHVQGFTLVEVIVGMVIGMIGLIIMMQVFSIFEGQKRTTTGGSDAQTSGAVALYQLEREIKQAGYGTSSFDLIGCDITLLNGTVLKQLAPVTINYNGGITGATPLFSPDVNTDTLLIAYAGPNNQTEGDGITAQTVANAYAVASPDSFAVSDVVVALPAAMVVKPPTVRPACSLPMVQVSGIAIPNVTVTTSYAGMANGFLYNLGQAATIKINAYAIHSGSLEVCDYMASDCGAGGVWLPIAGDIVSMKAVYAVNTSATINGIIDTFSTSAALPTALSAVATSTQCKLQRVLAVAVALVARNTEFNKDVVTNTAANTGAKDNSPKWMQDGIDPIVKNPSVLGPGTGPNETWQHYRYKVFETVAPLRNVNWQGAKIGC